MTRRKAAVLAALVAVLLTATYLLTRRGSRSAEPALAEPPTPMRPPVPASTVPTPVTASDVPVAAVTSTNPEPRSWGTGRAVPARTPPAAVPVTAAQGAEPVEQPLPTWLRVSIVVAALVAFFAVSLIATKQV